MEEKEDDARNKKSTDIDEWDQKFMQVDQEMLFEIILVPSPPNLSYPKPLQYRALTTGRKLPRYQASSRYRMQDRRKHDQRQIP